jgi:hypothetical protein
VQFLQLKVGVQIPVPAWMSLFDLFNEPTAEAILQALIVQGLAILTA